MLDVLKGKKVLIVDDEPDVCEMLEDELSNCRIETARTYETARAKLSRETYDVVVLDIMGVKGHELLEEYAGRCPCIMLTAHALTPQDLRRSMAGGARLYPPKEELGRIDEYVAKVLHAREPLWGWLFKRLDFRRWFGKSWFGLDRDFLQGFVLTQEDVEHDLFQPERG